VSDTAAIRTGEELDTAALGGYLTGKLPGAEQGIVVEQYPGGHSNLTYRIRTPSREYVLRRGPLGPVPPKAHDMAREFHVLEAVHPHFAPAPEVLLLCEDVSVIGAVFFIMERRRAVPSPRNWLCFGIIRGGSAKDSSIAWCNCTEWILRSTG
jgi:aminoglycoside phosphotransferase (APT) family kinase protein